MTQDEHIQTLMGFGLTLLQAKTYLALAKLGKANANTIAKASNVARPDIYRIMPTLQKLGLTEKIIAKPTMYKATPIKESLSILLQNKKKKDAELQKKTITLISNFRENAAKIALQENDTEFKITSEIKLVHKTHGELSQKARESIEIAAPAKAIDTILFYDLKDYRKAMKRGVKIRMLAQKGEGEPEPRKPQALENPLFELKCVSNRFQFGMHIFDKKEMTLCISTKGGITSLQSTNPVFVTLASNYFNDLWNRTKFD